MAQEPQQALDIEQMKSDLADKASEMVGQAVEFAREKPHMAVGAALAIGWVLGNGLPPRVIMAAARIGWKAMLGGALAGGGLMSMLGGQDDAGSSAEAPRASQGTVRSGQPSSHRRASGETHGRSRNGSTSTGSTGSSGSGGGSAVKE